MVAGVSLPQFSTPLQELFDSIQKIAQGCNGDMYSFDVHRPPESLQFSHRYRIEIAMNRWKRFLSSEDGPTAVEYGIVLGLIIVVSAGTLGGFGTGLHNIYLIIRGALP